jgi:DNA repair exonuclease SbcCD nuclease subunit
MTRFLYVADTHLGASPMGYQQQPGYPDRTREIVAAVRSFIRSKGDVDFVLHGGDMVDAATAGNIREAHDVFDVGVPVYLCVGNHDLTERDAVRRWLEAAPRFFPGGEPAYTVATPDCRIHVVPNHWGDERYYWGESLRARLSADQVAFLEEALAVSPRRPHVILTHSPVHGLPVEQTGFAEPHHAPDTSFTGHVTALVAAKSSVRCVLGAHTHMNMCVERGGVMYVTVSALVETPFEMKLFEVGPDSMNMSTVSLGALGAVDGEYDEARAYVQGRPVDRSFVMPV